MLVPCNKALRVMDGIMSQTCQTFVTTRLRMHTVFATLHQRQQHTTPDKTALSYATCAAGVNCSSATHAGQHMPFNSDTCTAPGIANTCHILITHNIHGVRHFVSQLCCTTRWELPHNVAIKRNMAIAQCYYTTGCSACCMQHLTAQDLLPHAASTSQSLAGPQRVQKSGQCQHNKRLCRVVHLLAYNIIRIQVIGVPHTPLQSLVQDKAYISQCPHMKLTTLARLEHSTHPALCEDGLRVSKGSSSQVALQEQAMLPRTEHFTDRQLLPCPGPSLQAPPVRLACFCCLLVMPYSTLCQQLADAAQRLQHISIGTLPASCRPW
eukprot:GHRR01001647.1.p1 GENE.GHRR01001647.1~~GHRR01001647.1.p1  ORF type:complete len:323 (-),score=29.65 GHRR01001647.1:531-1499(-)